MGEQGFYIQHRIVFFRGKSLSCLAQQRFGANGCAIARAWVHMYGRW